MRHNAERRKSYRQPYKIKVWLAKERQRVRILCDSSRSDKLLNMTRHEAQDEMTSMLAFFMGVAYLEGLQKFYE